MANDTLRFWAAWIPEMLSCGHYRAGVGTQLKAVIRRYGELTIWSPAFCKRIDQSLQHMTTHCYTFPTI